MEQESGKRIIWHRLRTKTRTPRVLLLWVGLTCAVMVGCGGEPPPYPEDAKKLAIETIIAQHQVVTDAGIEQDGHDLKLVVLVIRGTLESAAREIGENFVRLVRSLGPGKSLSKKMGEVGQTLYDYRLAVCASADLCFAQGVKNSSSTNIYWVDS